MNTKTLIISLWLGLTGLAGAQAPAAKGTNAPAATPAKAKPDLVAFVAHEWNTSRSPFRYESIQAAAMERQESRDRMTVTGVFRTTTGDFVFVLKETESAGGELSFDTFTLKAFPFILAGADITEEDTEQSLINLDQERYWFVGLDGNTALFWGETQPRDKLESHALQQDGRLIINRNGARVRYQQEASTVITRTKPKEVPKPVAPKVEAKAPPKKAIPDPFGKLVYGQATDEMDQIIKKPLDFSNTNQPPHQPKK